MALRSIRLFSFGCLAVSGSPADVGGRNAQPADSMVSDVIHASLNRDFTADARRRPLSAYKLPQASKLLRRLTARRGGSQAHLTSIPPYSAHKTPECAAEKAHRPCWRRPSPPSAPGSWAAAATALQDRSPPRTRRRRPRPPQSQPRPLQSLRSPLPPLPTSRLAALLPGSLPPLLRSPLRDATWQAGWRGRLPTHPSRVHQAAARPDPHKRLLSCALLQPLPTVPAGARPVSRVE
jgi:hypothetical protein